MSPEDRRSLAFGRATAATLLADPDGVMAKTWRNLARLRGMHRNGHSEPYFREWEELLSDGLEATGRMLSTSERASDMRSAAPFPRILTEEERRAVIEATTEAYRRAAQDRE